MGETDVVLATRIFCKDCAQEIARVVESSNEIEDMVDARTVMRQHLADNPSHVLVTETVSHVE